MLYYFKLKIFTQKSKKILSETYKDHLNKFKVEKLDSIEKVYKLYDSLSYEKNPERGSPLVKALKKNDYISDILKGVSHIKNFINTHKSDLSTAYKEEISSRREKYIQDGTESLCPDYPEDIIRELNDKIASLESNLSKGYTKDSDWFNISEQDSGGFASYKVINEFYNKTPHLATDINIIVNKVCQNISYNKDKLKDNKDLFKKQILDQFMEKLPLIVHNYLLYGVTYIVPERIENDPNILDKTNTEEVNAEDNLKKYTNLSKKEFGLRVLTPLEAIPRLIYFDGLLSKDNFEKYNQARKWGWKQYDPFDMFYIYRTKNTVVENLIIPVVSLSKSGNTDNKIKLRGGDESLLSRFIDLYAGLRLVEQTLLSTIPFTNILTVKDSSAAFSSLLTGDNYDDETSARIVNELVNSALDGSMPLFVTSPNSETRFDSPVFEHLISVYKTLLSVKNRAISGDPLKTENNTYDEGNNSFIHWLSKDVIEYLFCKYSKMVKDVYGVEIEGYLQVTSDSWFFNAHEKKIRAITKLVDTLSNTLVAPGAMSPNKFVSFISETIGLDTKDYILNDIVDVPIETLKKNYIKTLESNAKKSNASKTVAESDNDND